MRKTVLVVGGTSGIGKYCAQPQIWGGNNTRVIIAGRSVQDSSDGLNINCDVRNLDQIQRLSKIVQQTTDGNGPDVFLYASGISKSSLLVSQLPTDIEDVINTNLVGCINVTRMILKQMVRRRVAYEDVNRHLLFIGSIVGSHGNAGQSVYAASKAGLLGLSRSLALELGSRQIRSNVIEPGFIDTPMLNEISEDQKNTYKQQIPLKRFGTCEDVGEAVKFIDRCRYVNGQVIRVDGGLF